MLRGPGWVGCQRVMDGGLRRKKLGKRMGGDEER